MPSNTKLPTFLLDTIKSGAELLAMNLEEYLRVQLPRHQQRLVAIRAVAAEVVQSLPLTFDKAKKAWPYRVLAGESPRAPANYSFSTAAMNLFTLRALLGLRDGCPFKDLVPRVRLRDILQSVKTDDAAALETELSTMADQASAALQQKTRRRHKIITESRTFGNNDPLTLGWLLATTPNAPVRWKKPIRGAVLSCLTRPDDYRLGPDTSSYSHALPVARFCHLASKCDWLAISGSSIAPARAWFTRTIHQHLAYAALPNASFDAPELVFCLEGLLTCKQRVHGFTELLHRSVEVIRDKQASNPNLRPYRPLLSTERGLALLPLTIEVFNALLRILEILGADAGEQATLVSIQEIIDRYVDWLLSQVTRIALSNEEEVVGWCSEHTHTSGIIHVWETSQVLLFLVHYATWLLGANQRALLQAANFQLVWLQRDAEDFWPQDEAECATRELMKEEPVYGHIWRDFILPRHEGHGGAQWSLLLSGPPGTGKTTFAEFLAAHLEWPLLALAPSDFLVGGSEKVEERAKTIFRVLMELREVVILFDEIDRLVLDRDSVDYSMQGDVFQFMTPSMLTKLRELRKAERCIFIIATNYEERIDPAIKRRGRIDRSLIVMPPELAARERWLLEKLPRQKAKRVEIANSTALFTFVELKAIVAGVSSGARVTDAIEANGPSLTMASYIGRMGLRRTKSGLELESRGYKPPLREFKLAERLVREARGIPSIVEEIKSVYRRELRMDI